MESLLRYMAVDRAIKNWDGVTALYSLCDGSGCHSPGPHNLCWYHDTGLEGRFHLVPWDMDNAFQAFEPYVDTQLISPTRREVLRSPTAVGQAGSAHLLALAVTYA